MGEILFWIAMVFIVCILIYGIIHDGKISDQRYEEKKRAEQAKTIAGLPAVALSDVVPVTVDLPKKPTPEEKALAKIGKAIDDSAPDDWWIEIDLDDKKLSPHDLKPEWVQSAHSRSDLVVGAKNVDLNFTKTALLDTIRGDKPTMEEIAVGGRNQFSLPAFADITAFDDLKEGSCVDLPGLVIREGVVIQARRHVAAVGGRVYVSNTAATFYTSASFEFYRPGSTKEHTKTEGVLTCSSLTAETIALIKEAERILVYRGPAALHVQVDCGQTVFVFTDRHEVLSGECDPFAVTPWTLGAQLTAEHPSIAFEELGDAVYGDVVCKSFAVGDKIVHHLEAM